MSLYRRISNLFSRTKVEREIDAELRAHIELRMEDNIAAGMSPAAARRDALLRFGNPVVVKEAATAADAALFLESIRSDVRFAIRQLWKSPGFAVAAVLALSLGIGAASAIFSVVDAVLLRPLPFANQERLVFPFMKGRTGGSLPSSVLSYRDERAQLKTFAALAGYSLLDRINLEGPSGAVSLRAVKGTDNFFDVFGVRPILGRTYLPGEDIPGKDNVAVLSYEVWQSQFNGRADTVGKTVKLDGSPYEIVGVMPAGFRFPLGVRDAIYTPLHAPEQWAKARGMHWMRTVGLLKPGVSLEEAQADISRVMANLGQSYPDQEGGHTATLYPLAAEVNGFGSDGSMRGPVRALVLAMLALLGIACVNIAGLLLARGVSREREMALRAAVGANRRRLIRQMINESMVLSVAGVLGGVLTGWLLLKAMSVFLVDAIARGADVHLNMKVVLVALVLSVATSMLASLAPALRLSGTDPNRALRMGAGAGTGRGQHRLRSGFVVTQIALSLVLLMMAGLLLRNLQNLFRIDLGFDPAKILTVNIDLSRGHYEGRDPIATFYRPLLERVSHLPGVQAAGVIDLLPVLEWGDGYEVHITGQPPYAKNVSMAAETRNVSPGYFDVMGIKLLRGRTLSASLDGPDNVAGTMVVNEAFRKKFFSGGGDPVGAHIDDADKAEGKSAIVGVATSIKQDLYSPPMPEMDWLIDEIPVKNRVDPLRNMFLMVRVSGDPAALAPSLRNAMHDIDSSVPFRGAETMDQVVSERLILQRMESWLFGIFAGFALLLAMIGLYGLIQHEVVVQTREVGIRMALGSTRMRVVGGVIRRVAFLMLGGVSIGWVLTLALKKVTASVVESKSGYDFLLLAGLTIALAAAGIAASLIPARRAASIDPMQALRSE
jgi:predicted permease